MRPLYRSKTEELMAQRRGQRAGSRARRPTAAGFCLLILKPNSFKIYPIYGLYSAEKVRVCSAGRGCAGYGHRDKAADFFAQSFFVSMMKVLERKSLYQSKVREEKMAQLYY